MERKDCGGKKIRVRGKAMSFVKEVLCVGMKNARYSDMMMRTDK